MFVLYIYIYIYICIYIYIYINIISDLAFLLISAQNCKNNTVFHNSKQSHEN